MADEQIEFPCIEVTQPIGTFYIGAIEASDLVAISYADVRRPEGREIERYIGTQMELSEGRVAEITQYVTNIDACFPTSVILAINSDNAEFVEATKTLRIRKNAEVAKIIDGQHRIAGLDGYNGTRFQINVTIFVDMDIEDQAMVFATINLKQTKVGKSLAYDLYEYAESRSPQKTSHNVVKLMNFEGSSPFKNRIKILGKATGTGTEVITQATFVDRLLKLITTNAMADKDRIKRGLPLIRAEGKEQQRLVFRNRFVDGHDAEIAKILWNYFKAVEERWTSAWNSFEKGMILSRTTGFAALMRVLPEILKTADPNQKKIPTVDEFKMYLDKVNLEDKDFTSDKFKPGSTGEGDLVKDLREAIVQTSTE